MASRSCDSKVALLFREERRLTGTMWRHLADKWSRGRQGEPGGGEKGGSGLGGAELGSRKGLGKTTFP